MTMPTNDAARKRLKIFQGFVNYFPDAIAAVAELSVIANEQHNPGQPVHWAKEKSTEELDSLMRHMVGVSMHGPTVRDEDGVLEATKIAWRALANLQRLADGGQDIMARSNDAVGLSFMKAIERGTEIQDINSLVDAPHEPTIDEKFDMERTSTDVVGGPFDAVFIEFSDDGTKVEHRRGPYETIAQVNNYIERNPENLPGIPAVKTSKLTVRETNA